MKSSFRKETGNPVFRFFMRKNLSVIQIGMLLIATTAAFLASLYLRQSVRNPVAEAFYWIFRWGLGEFLWCWMAADHVFTIVGDLKKTGKLRDMRITFLTESEIVRGLVFSTALFLSVGVTGWLIAELAVPWPSWSRLHSLNPEIRYFFFAGLPLIIWVNHIATGLLAAAFCTRQAMPKADSPMLNWAGTLATLGSRLFLILLPGLVFGGYIMYLSEGEIFKGHRGGHPVRIWVMGFVLLTITLIGKVIWFNHVLKDAETAAQISEEPA